MLTVNVPPVSWTLGERPILRRRCQASDLGGDGVDGKSVGLADYRIDNAARRRDGDAEIHVAVEGDLALLHVDGRIEHRVAPNDNGRDLGEHRQRCDLYWIVAARAGEARGEVVACFEQRGHVDLPKVHDVGNRLPRLGHPSGDDPPRTVKRQNFADRCCARNHQLGRRRRGTRDSRFDVGSLDPATGTATGYPGKIDACLLGQLSDRG